MLNELRQAVDASGEIIFMTDRDGVFTFVNRRFEVAYGYTSEEVVGRTTPRLLRGEPPPQEVYADFWRRLTRGESVQHTFRNRTKDGRLIDIEAAASPIADGAGALVGFLAIQRDVTARKAAEEHARFQQAVLATERELTLDGILVVDHSARVLSFNRRFVQMWGVPDEELGTGCDGALLEAVLHKLRDPEQFLAKVQALYEQRELVSRDEIELLDGRVFDRYSAPMHGPEGRYYGRVWYFRDVTERRQAIDALRSAEERTRFALENAGVGTWDADYSTGVVVWSPILERQYGLAPGTFGGTYDAFVALLHPEDRGSVLRTIEKGAQSGDDFRLEHRIVRPDGTVRWVSGAGRILLDAAGRPVRGVGISIDVSDHKALELELRHAQKLEAMGRLAAGVAHEINTPVQFVGDSVRFVQEAVGDLFGLVAKYQDVCGMVAADRPAGAAAQDARRCEDEIDLPYLFSNMPDALDRARRGLHRVATIVQSMKEFAHPDRTEMIAVDLNRALQNTLTIARTEYKYVADVETDYGDIPLVTCHAGEINQVFLNIIVNAAHAIAEKCAGSNRRGRIRIETRAEGDSAVVRIADSGSGIPIAVRDRVFEPFFTTKAVGHGTGQGLAMARNVVVEKHGGELTFESEVGHGTTFVVRLPVHAQQSSEVLP